ncbi:membrane protein [Corynebacterium phocae]|uniref:Membrane protein n=1 Tax=Corynebacterium phocae TaxID=161895 RepID=A0A1L7D1X7_9CORY|nr:CNNM domain-containing protein [Corynebacterium phocae]APT92108.1 membrane protein [Corynebacterium phocae]KAA8726494.1 DUF21 domain-containing protein [Corynebacterium phocae]
MFNIVLTILILIASAFFVVIEFATMGARRHRLEETAENSRASRAGLRSLNELTLMLAGAQFGITAATFALGAITEPWVHHLLAHPLHDLGLPHRASDVVAFLLALFIVTFLHLVVGEMAPKSWAITHPETALKLVAVPARGFIWVFRPLLLWVNRMANRLVRAAGEEPVDSASAAGYDVETLRSLVEHSRDTGALDQDSANQITGVIELESATTGDLAREHGSKIVPLPADATVADVQEFVGRKRTMRVLIADETGRALQVVHVRDTLLAAPTELALQFAQPVLRVTPQTKVQSTLDTMRARGKQLVVVGAPEADNAVWSLTWDNIMGQLWPQIAEQLDQQAPAKNTEV